MKLKERVIEENGIHGPMDAPHLFIQNNKVGTFNERVHREGKGEKYAIKAVDSVIKANSAQLCDKILHQKTKQIRSILQLSAGERTEIALNL